MQSWSQFYKTIAAPSAALLGLLFVAVSINAPAALGSDRVASKRLTEQAFQNYLAVMMVALVALLPDISTRAFGIVCLIATASWSLWVVIRFYGPHGGEVPAYGTWAARGGTSDDCGG